MQGESCLVLVVAPRAYCNILVAQREASATIDAAAGRRVGGAGISGLLLAGGVLNDAMLTTQTAGVARSLPFCSQDNTVVWEVYQQADHANR